MKHSIGTEEVSEVLDYEKQLWEEVEELEAELEEEHTRRPKDQAKIRTLTRTWSEAIRRWSSEYDRNHRWNRRWNMTPLAEGQPQSIAKVS